MKQAFFSCNEYVTLNQFLAVLQKRFSTNWFPFCSTRSHGDIIKVDVDLTPVYRYTACFPGTWRSNRYRSGLCKLWKLFSVCKL